MLSMVVSAEDRAETVPQESMGHERTVGVQVEPRFSDIDGLERLRLGFDHPFASFVLFRGRLD